MTALQAAVAKPSRNKPAESRHRASRRLICLAAFLWVLAAFPGWGQGLGEVSNAQRMLDGKPDLNGIWQALNTAAWDIQDHLGQLDIPPGQSVVEGKELPYQPWAAKKKEENAAQRKTADPTGANCFLPGVPRATYLPYPFEIVQTPGRIAILSGV